MSSRQRIHHLLLISVLLVAAMAPASTSGAMMAQPIGNGGGPPSAPASASASTNQWYSTQLHQHSWSNHNAAWQPASMQLHSNWASGTGLDVLWWADHNPSFNQAADMPFGFAEATINPNTLDVAIPLPPGLPFWAVYNYVTQLRASVSSGGQAAASLNNAMLRMQVQANADQTWDRFEYRTLTTNGLKIQGLGFTRPLASDPVLSFDAARCDSAGSNAYGQVRVAMSWHDYGTPVSQDLIYRLVPANQPGGIVQSSSRVTVTVPLVTSRVELPLLDHASLLPDGDDNAIQEMYFTVGARNSAQACLELGNFNIHSRRPQASQIVQAQKDVAARHQATYGVTQHVTWEQFAGLRHLNPYLPTTSALLPGLDDIQAQNFVPLVHAERGLAMLNHPFGAGNGDPLSVDEQEAQVQSLLSLMTPINAWNADLFEIYRLRARVDLYHHMRLWDLLGANGVSMCATSTSDAHGGPFDWNHAMVVWINAASPGQDDLLAGLRACRVFFGDLELFDGVLDLRLGSTPMGSVYPARPGVAPLHVTLDPLPAGAQVKLVQQLLQPGNELVHLVDHQVIDPTQPVMIDVSQPSQVRVEVWTADGRMMVFSNRITIQHMQCDMDSSGLIDIVDVQVVAAAFGQNVPPAPTRYDLRADGRIDLWDVMAAGECWLARNAPAP
jgi:hypothetical protein